jgi:hypothetical protein
LIYLPFSTSLKQGKYSWDVDGIREFRELFSSCSAGADFLCCYGGDATSLERQFGMNKSLRASQPALGYPNITHISYEILPS